MFDGISCATRNRTIGFIGGLLLSALIAAPAAAQASGGEVTTEDGSPTEKESEEIEAEESSVEDRLQTLEEEVDRRTGAEAESEAANSADDEEEASLDEQLDTLEGEVSGQGGSSGGGGGSSDNELNPDLSVILDTGFAWQSDDALLLGGPDPKKFGFFLQAVELALQADVDPFFTFDSHLVAKLDGLKIGEAYGTTLSLPAQFQVRFGKFKTRFGRVNPRHLHAWHFTALPIVNGEMFGPAGLNGLGLEISQLLPLPWYVEWRVAVQDLSSAATGRSFLRTREYVQEPLDLVASGRLKQFFALSDAWSLLVGLNAAVGRNDSGGRSKRRSLHTEIYGLDTFLKWKSTTRQEIGWQTEALLRRRETPDGERAMAGGYSYVYWVPGPRWEFGGRGEFVSQPFDGSTDELPPASTEERQRAGVAASFYPSEFSRLRLEYMLDDFDDGAEQFGHTVLLQAQLVTGAHGAHRF